MSSLVDEVQFDKSNYSTRSSCLDHIQCMKAQSYQSRTVNVEPMFLNVCIALVHSYVCVWGGGGGGGG